MPLTDFFIDYVPLYNKFRAVSSTHVIAEFTIPMLAIFALKRLLEEPEILKQEKKPLGISLLLTAGVALLLAVAPGSIGSGYVPAQEAQMLQTAVTQQMIPPTRSPASLPTWERCVQNSSAATPCVASSS